MAQQDLIQKTRFEKQIPFPILAAIAADIANLDTNYPLDRIEEEVQYEEILELAEDLGVSSIRRDISDRDKLVTIAAECIRTLRLIEKLK